MISTTVTLGKQSKYSEKRSKRRKETAEDFTPATLVNEMLDKLPKSTWEPNKTFCDPACGHGNMLVEVLKRKLQLKHDPTEALDSVYGTDIKEDNILETRLRLLKLVSEYTLITSEHIRTVFSRILFLSLPKYPNGSLDFNFEFPKKTKHGKATIDKWLANMNTWLSNVSVDEGILNDLESLDEAESEEPEQQKSILELD